MTGTHVHGQISIRHGVASATPLFFSISLLCSFTHILIRTSNFFLCYTCVYIFTNILIRELFCNLSMCLYFYSYINKRTLFLIYTRVYIFTHI